MNLSNILCNSIYNKLKLTVLYKEKFYVKNLFNQINQLEQVKKENDKSLSKKNINDSLKKDLTIYYILNISFLKTNTTVHFSDMKGNVKFFYSAGNLNLKGKQKIKRKTVIGQLIKVLFKKISFLKKKPIALHLNNVKFYKRTITKQLKKVFFIKVIKSFNLISYNGCRKKKIRRKKFNKKFK